MRKKISLFYILILLLLYLFIINSCGIPKNTTRSENKNLPNTYSNTVDTTSIANITWKKFFNDTNLQTIIDSVVKNNQELNTITQEILIRKNEINARKGDYLPFVNFYTSADVTKVGEYTRNGSVEENLTIKENTPFPKPLPNMDIGVLATWEVDIWKKLRNAKKTATLRYLASVDGKNFILTNLVAEVANLYYELIALDNLLAIINQNIVIQKNALEIIKQEKNAAKTTQLAVNRFEAQLLNTQNLQYEIKQQITVIENKLNFLAGQQPQPIKRSSQNLQNLNLDTVTIGKPKQLLVNRPDIRAAELNLSAAKVDVQIAKANFYPSLRLNAATGLQAYSAGVLINPKSLLYSLAGDALAPLINRKAIKTTYANATANQLRSVIEYEQTVLNAYIEVLNQYAQINNYTNSFATKLKEVEILNQSVTISTNLFLSARADYMEVLLTQKEALNSKMELIDIKLKLMQAKINMYRVLGGGWR